MTAGWVRRSLRSMEAVSQGTHKGGVGQRALSLGLAAVVETAAGRWDSADRHAAELLDLAEQTGTFRLPSLRMSAHLAVLRGDVEEARVLIAHGIAEAEPLGELHNLRTFEQLDGFLALSLGGAEAALPSLRRAREIAERMSVGEPSMLTFLLDEVEAHALLDDAARAAAVLTAFDRRCTGDRAPWIAPLALRARGLVEAAARDLETACASLESAVASEEDLPLPLERARTRLALGRVLRRLQQAFQGQGRARRGARAVRRSRSGPLGRTHAGGARAHRRPCAVDRRSHSDRAANRGARGGRDDESRGGSHPVRYTEDCRVGADARVSQAGRPVAHRARPPPRRAGLSKVWGFPGFGRESRRPRSLHDRDGPRGAGSVSGARLLDDLARTLAEPMARRGALRLLGASVAAVAVPGLRPRAAAARPTASAPCGPDRRECQKGAEAGFEKYCCPAPSWKFFCGSERTGYRCENQCIPPAGFPCTALIRHPESGINGVCCDRKLHSHCEPVGKPATCCYGQPFKCEPMGQAACRAKGATAQWAPSEEWKPSCCPKAFGCGGVCCQPPKRCKSGRCRCPDGSESCDGSTCCPKGKNCATCYDTTSVGVLKGPVSSVGWQRTKVGKKCCAPGQMCCRRTCCRGITCCGDKCCPDKQLCAASVPGGKDTCCPVNRIMSVPPSNRFRCCPAGTVTTNFGCCPPNERDCCPPVDGNGRPIDCQARGMICVRGRCQPV